MVDLVPTRPWLVVQGRSSAEAGAIRRAAF
jgi:hypothetical protein